VSEKPKIAEAAREELRKELVPDVAECILGHVIDAAETVGREYDPDAGDDPNLAGIMVSRRGKNVAAQDLRAQNLDGVVVRAAKGFTWDINADGTRLHTYSAPAGLDDFQLVGGDRKAEIVERSIKQLSLFEDSGTKRQPGDLVLAYVRARGGLLRAVLGVMSSADEFAWHVSTYSADLAAAPTQGHTADRRQSFREQPDKQADLSLKQSQDERENL
jgi:hypothetical protein